MSPLTAEFVGTALLLLLGDGVVANVVLRRTKGSGSGWMVISMGWGMAVFVAVFVVARFSGAHINPAVTLGLAAAGNFAWGDVPSYVAAQMLGAQDFDLIMVDVAVFDGGGQGVVRKLRRELRVTAPIIALGENLDPATIAFLKPDVAAIVSKATGFAARVRDEVGLILKSE